MKQKDAYEKKMQAKLDEWSAQLDVLKAKANKADADAKMALRERIDAVEAKREVAREKLAELKDSSEDAWEDLKHGVAGAWASLDTAMQAAKSRFESEKSS